MNEVVDRFSGIGTVWDGTQKLGEAEYDLVVSQRGIDTSTHEGQSSVRGKKSVSGTLTPTEDTDFSSGDLLGERLTLELKDERKIDFLVKSLSGTGPISIVGSGGFYE